MNILLNQETDSNGLELVEHVASCETCGKKYRALSQLKQEMIQPKRHMVRWALGAAAVLTMASYPYFKPIPKDTPRAAPAEKLAMADQTSPDLLEHIRQVNRQDQLQQWGANTNVIDLIKKG